ncbi:cyclin dependent kinase inhibitor 1Bb [Cololabis saira]|uniref:cyclin dependent kinase inhibitor 1Bb n=1 Tax=Cololabis saira TaxID=129043 RepID=UPI002AD54733|nr:cyclin dependent kinase inhibitor 1Bb [Cololabis saira]
MSHVRLSSGSPPLERPEPPPRRAEQPKPSACKSLFGSVNHDELQKDLRGHLRELEEAAVKKWGFDFARDKPLSAAAAAAASDGGGGCRLEWDLVDGSDMPDFYTRQPRRERRSVCSGNNNNVDLNGNHSCVVMMAPTSEDNSSHRECTEQCTGLRKRPACHDSSAQNKRSHTSTEEVSCPSLSHSAEHTPRKTSPKRQT